MTRFYLGLFVIISFGIFLLSFPKDIFAAPLDIDCRAYDLNGGSPVVGDTIRWSYIPISLPSTGNLAGTWDWVFSDGTRDTFTIGTNPDVFKVYRSPGRIDATFTVTLTAPTRESDTARCSITILASAPPPPAGVPPPVGGTIPPPPSGSPGPPAADAFCGIGESTPEVFASKLFECGLGFIGGVALIAILIGAYIILSSQGDPGRIQVGKEYITYAIIGILMAVSAFVLYRVVASDILKIPGFS